MGINKVMSSTIGRKIIAFFHENPSSVDTVEGIAKWIGEDAVKVSKSLEELAKLNILVAHEGITTGYGYTQDDCMLHRIGVLLRKRRKGNGRRKKFAKTSVCKFSEDKN